MQGMLVANFSGSENAVRRQEVVFLRLQPGEKPARRFRELRGHVLARVVTPAEALITVDNATQAVGQAFRGREGGFVKVLQASREADGQLRLVVQVEMPPDATPARLTAPGAAAWAPGGPPMQPPGFGPMPRLGNMPGMANPQMVLRLGANPMAGSGFFGDGLNVFDEQGQPLQHSLIQIQPQMVGNTFLMEYTLTCPAPQGPGGVRLVLSGKRCTALEVPFAFRDVPLP
jgi:hypothetical protein